MFICTACRLTSVYPDQSTLENRRAWHLAEQAKRRWLYTINQLNLPAEPKLVDEQNGLTFQLLQPDAGPNSVLTGHQGGTITINVAECDPVNRLSVRAAMDEPYRTLLGHFRHESGHYYWERLIASKTARLDAFRQVFGDDRADYAEALQSHHAKGPPDDWQERFVSAYAASHPWEDFAETWAHYMHMVDALDLARHWGLELGNYPDMEAENFANQVLSGSTFHSLLERWLPLSLFANSLNRSLGHEDAYPFAPSEIVILKLQWIHELLETPDAPANNKH